MKKKSYVFFLLLIGVWTSCTHETISPTAQLKTDTLAIRSFLTNNNISAIKTSQGVWYSIGNGTLGPYPALADSVKISYTTKLIPKEGGNLASLTQVASVSSATVLLSSVISGLQIGLSWFPVGSAGKIIIPSGLAFGATGTANGSIPPNSNLLYEITLISASGTRLATDKTAINTWITSKADSLVGITMRVDAGSGIKFSYDSLRKNAIYPSLVSKSHVDVSYTLKTFGSKSLLTMKEVEGETIDLNDPTTVTALKIILPQITVGSNVTIYVPSSYGYGANAVGTVPANSNLIYQVNLKGAH